MKDLLLILKHVKGGLILLLLFGAAAGMSVDGIDEADGRLGNVEFTVVKEQMSRTHRAINKDIVFLGDSTALNDIDASGLQQATGQSVVSVAVMAACGPETINGQLEVILDQITDSTDDHRPHIIVTINPISFQRYDSNLAGFSSKGLTGVQQTLSMQRQIRYSVRALMGRLLTWPLPGSFGVAHGDSSGLIHAMDLGSGTFADPNPPLHSVRLIEDVTNDVSAIKHTEHQILTNIDPTIIAKLRASGCSVDLLITPIPLEISTRKVMLAILSLNDNTVNQLGLNDWIPMPWEMSGELFANQHLSAEGRATYTKALAIKLQQRYSD